MIKICAILFIMTSFLSAASGQISTGIVIVNTASISADSIVSSGPTDSLCPGDEVTLSLAGGILGTGAQWVWYRDALPFDTGVSISITAGDTAVTYSCTAEGGCNVTIERFRDIYILSDSLCGVLPLEWLSFKASIVNEDEGMLEWHISGEDHIRNFIIEKSLEGQVFHSIGELRFTAGDPVYSFIDKELSYALNFYRIKLVRDNGGYAYSPVRMINYSVTARSMEVYPNPTGGSLYMKFYERRESVMDIWIVNVFGQKVMVLDNEKVVKGENVIELNLNRLPQGTYFLNYDDGSERKGSVRFTKIK